MPGWMRHQFRGGGHGPEHARPVPRSGAAAPACAQARSSEAGRRRKNRTKAPRQIRLRLSVPGRKRQAAVRGLPVRAGGRRQDLQPAPARPEQAGRVQVHEGGRAAGALPPAGSMRGDPGGQARVRVRGRKGLRQHGRHRLHSYDEPHGRGQMAFRALHGEPEGRRPVRHPRQRRRGPHARADRRAGGGQGCQKRAHPRPDEGLRQAAAEGRRHGFFQADGRRSGQGCAGTPDAGSGTLRRQRRHAAGRGRRILRPHTGLLRGRRAHLPGDAGRAEAAGQLRGAAGGRGGARRRREQEQGNGHRRLERDRRAAAARAHQGQPI